MKQKFCLLIVLAVSIRLSAQTKINLRTQALDVDFTNAVSTRPIKTGNALPPACTVGDLYFLVTAPAGQNLFGCNATDSWQAQNSVVGLLTIQSDGSALGSSSTLNVVAGTGVTCIPQEN